MVVVFGESGVPSLLNSVIVLVLPFATQMLPSASIASEVDSALFWLVEPPRPPLLNCSEIVQSFGAEPNPAHCGVPGMRL